MIMLQEHPDCILVLPAQQWFMRQYQERAFNFPDLQISAQIGIMYYLLHTNLFFFFYRSIYILCNF